MRFFNTEGPCDPARHYMLPVGDRLPTLRRLIAQQRYVVVHAPRQTGKTTTLRVLARELTATGEWAALHFSCQWAQAMGDDYVAAQRAILAAIAGRADSLPADLRPPDPWPAAAPEAMLATALTGWARRCPRPLVLFFDEIDTMTGRGLLSVLGQLRAGLETRPDSFPASVVLCGLRDVRDYTIGSASGSPFNIKKSLRLSDFSEAQVRELYAQHTAETGQAFTEEALARAWESTQGQPWLVNALAAEVIDEMAIADTIEAEHIDTARERLIRARATHLDSLLAKLQEPRVRRVMAPMIAGTDLALGPEVDDDLSYVRDLGLIASTMPPRMANPIYQEVVVRVLGTAVEARVAAEPRSFVDPDGRLDWDKLLGSFADFWLEQGELATEAKVYEEAMAHLVFMTFLTKVVNGGGFVSREYGVGTGRVDLLVRWPYVDEDGQRQVQRQAIELKVWHDGKRDPAGLAVVQLENYLARLGLHHGTAIVFDGRHNAPPIDQRLRRETVKTDQGRLITVLHA